MNYQGRPAWRHQWFALCVVLVLLLVAVIVPLFIATFEGSIGSAIGYLFPLISLILVLVILYRRYSWKYSVTPETIESRHGIIARNISSIRVKDLRNVNLKQSLFQRILRIGDLEFSSAGGSGIEVTFFGIPDPMEVKKQVQTLQGAHDG